ncbi:hypothetical protein [Salinimicrobium flavum]|uniref:Uncharacterized protein n=1 Tax=Salinimicrobium flavum TaxID=1737065 RepID=A0ABW5IV34_9FLAO
MSSLLIQAAEETSKSIPYQIGYTIGHLVGSHLFETITALVLIIATVVYFSFFRSKKNRKTRV